MTQHPYIKEIADALARGESKENIYRSLLESGVSVKEIERGFAAVKTQKPSGDSNHSRMITAIVIIGAVFVGIGIASLIAANWSTISPTTKVVIILCMMLSSYAGGWYLLEHTKATRSGAALILLGALIYGGGIFLVAQIFHIRAEWLDGMVLWIIGVIAIAIALQTIIPLFVLAMILALVTLCIHMPIVFEMSSVATDAISLPLLIALTISLYVTHLYIHRVLSYQE